MIRRLALLAAAAARLMERFASRLYGWATWHGARGKYGYSTLTKEGQREWQQVRDAQFTPQDYAWLEQLK